MAKDKDHADRNAHERQPAEEREDVEDSEQTAEKSHKHKRNPLSDLRFGSAGSGGAEREPGPERP